MILFKIDGRQSVTNSCHLVGTSDGFVDNALCLERDTTPISISDATLSFLLDWYRDIEYRRVTFSVELTLNHPTNNSLAL